MLSRNAEPQEVVLCDGCKTIPLSVLSLDLDEPIDGWEETLLTRGIELTEDDMGRAAVGREDARALMAERRERELQSAEETRRREEEVARESRPVHPGSPGRRRPTPR